MDNIYDANINFSAAFLLFGFSDWKFAINVILARI